MPTRPGQRAGEGEGEGENPLSVQFCAGPLQPFKLIVNVFF